MCIHMEKSKTSFLTKQQNQIYPGSELYGKPRYGMARYGEVL